MENPASQILNPFPSQLNPHVEEVRAHLLDWVGDRGLLQGESERKRFEAADFGWFVAVVHPTADADRLALMADWFAWLFIFDDQLDAAASGRRLTQVHEVLVRLREVLGSDDFGAAIARRPDVPAIVSALADLWRRTAPQATPQWRQRFVRHLDVCLTTAVMWEAENWVKGVVPEKDAYIPNRRHTGAIYVCMDFIDVVERLDVPEHIYESPQFTAALDAACNVVCWTNDMYSLEVERSRGEVHNLVFVIQHHRGIGRHEALAEVGEAISAETELFLLEERELLGAFPHQGALLRAYLSGMRSWMRGNLDWSRRTKRYQIPSAEEAWRPPRPFAPPGSLDQGGR